MAELVFFDRWKLRYIFQPQLDARPDTRRWRIANTISVRVAQHHPPAPPPLHVRCVDLTVPHVRAREFTCGLSQGLSSPSQEDMVVSFGIFQRLYGVFVNLAGWCHAFKQAMRPIDWRGSGGAKTDASKNAHQKGEKDSSPCVDPALEWFIRLRRCCFLCRFASVGCGPSSAIPHVSHHTRQSRLSQVNSSSSRSRAQTHMYTASAVLNGAAAGAHTDTRVTTMLGVASHLLSTVPASSSPRSELLREAPRAESGGRAQSEYQTANGE
jgi:hypothetical protein